MPLRCRNCGMLSFRRSRLRNTDLVRLLLLQYPVRCRKCLERTYAFIFELFTLKSVGDERSQDPLPK